MSLGLAYRAGRRRRPSLTPMIDVVFLLLVFFMLAARFGSDGALALAPAGGGAAPYSGPPRLVTVAPGALWLNGVAVDADALVEGLGQLTEAPSDIVVLRGSTDATAADMVAALALLREAGFTALAVVE